MNKLIMYSEVSDDPPKANDFSLLRRLKYILVRPLVQLLPFLIPGWSPDFVIPPL